MKDSERAAISELVARRRITEVVHFTTNKGLLGCLAAQEVLPRNRLLEQQLLKHIAYPNARFRSEESDSFDKSEDWISYVNLSISEISMNLFRSSQRWHAGADVSWFIMAFTPVLLGDAGVYFSTTNNIYELTMRGTGSAGLEALFSPVVPRRVGWNAQRRRRLDHQTTCEQAEVLYPTGLPLTYFQRVYARDGDDADWATATLSTYGRHDVAVTVNPAKFNGCAN